MPRAVLQLAIEASPDAARALSGQVAGATRKAQEAANAEVRRGTAERRRIESEETRYARAQAAVRLRQRIDMEAARARIAKEATKRQQAEEATQARNAAKSEREKVKAAEKSAKDRERIEKGLTLAAAREEKQRTRDAEREDRARSAAARRADAERTRTARAEMQTRLRERVRMDVQGDRDREGRGRIIRRTVGGIVSRGFGALGSLADSDVDRVAAARQARAAPEHAINNALFQSGAGIAEARDMRARVFAFLNSPAGRGVSSEDAAQAISGAQEEFSTLQAPTPEARRERLEQMLAGITLARNTYQDPAQVLRMQGALSAGGLDRASQGQALRQLIGISFRGGVNLGDLTKQNLAAIQSRMATASAMLGPNASAEDQQRARRDALTQSVAELEVLRPRGFQGAAPGNQLAGLSQDLGTRQRQDLIHGRILAAQNRGSPEDRAAMVALESQMYEDDPNERGHRVLRREFRDVMRFGETAGAAVGNDPSRFMDLLGGGAGDHTVAGSRVQGLLRPQRRILAALLATNEQGQTGFEQVRRIQEGAAADVDESRGQALALSEMQTEIVRARELQVDRILSGSEGAARQAGSEGLARWQAEHPMANDLIDMLPGSGLIRDLAYSASTSANPAGQASAALGSLQEAGVSTVTLDAASISALVSGIAGHPITIDPQALAQARALEASGRGGSAPFAGGRER